MKNGWVYTSYNIIFQNDINTLQIRYYKGEQKFDYRCIKLTRKQFKNSRMPYRVI